MPSSAKHLRHGIFLAARFGMRGVADMQDDIGQLHLLQRGAKGLDQMSRQIGNETHRIGQDRLASCSGSLKPRIVGSSVANSMFFASTSAPVRRLNRLDLPALV